MKTFFSEEWGMWWRKRDFLSEVMWIMSLKINKNKSTTEGNKKKNPLSSPASKITAVECGIYVFL